MKYSLSVPFLERFFSLGRSRRMALLGQITANSFMNREFGKKLIEQFFPTVDLTHVIDMSGAAFGTRGFGGIPTTILFARNRRPVANTIRTVMGIRGEPSTPDDPARGLVWSAIVEQVDLPGSKSEFVSVGDSHRELFHKHPWSIGGGGAAELKERLEQSAATTLSETTEEIGILGMTNADEVMIAPGNAFARKTVEQSAVRRLALGDEVRDWRIIHGDNCLFPYRDEELIDIATIPGIERWLWPSRTVLGNRATFSRQTYFQEGRPWWEWHQVALRRLRSPFSIVFAFVATHNHFVLDRGGKVFKQTSPVIKLSPTATKEDYLSLLGLLNSSTACFWMKQVLHNLGSSVDQHGARQTAVAFENFWEHTSTRIEHFPVPGDRPFDLARLLDGLASARGECLLQKVVKVRPMTRSALEVASTGESITRSKMIALQEELDWQCYRLYGLIDQDLTYEKAQRPIPDVGQPPSAVSPQPPIPAFSVGQPPPAVSAAPNVGQPPPAVSARPEAKRTATEYRRKLPHFQHEGKTYAITFCSKDRWIVPEHVRDRILQHCLHDQDVKYHLHAAVVMPDHVHLLLSPLSDNEGNPYGLSQILSGIKGASAHSVNRMLGRKGSVWQDESFDHMLRSDEGIEAKAEYICQNPVRKNLAARPEDYPWLWRDWIEGRAEEIAERRQPRAAVPQSDAAVPQSDAAFPQSDSAFPQSDSRAEPTAEGGCPTMEFGIALGQRAFEIVLARKVAAGETQTTWFERHGSTPITEIPSHWPDDYRRLVEHRIALIESDPNIRLIEQPEYKRRWNTESWESQLERALREWLLDRLESYFDVDGRMNDQGTPTARLPIALISVGKLADVARQDPEFLQVGELYRDDPAFDVTRLVTELAEAESVPLLPILRYKPSGLRKREEWEQTWALQRQEDAIDAHAALPKDHPDHLSEADAIEQKKKQVGTIPVPPKYTSADFLKSDYWRLRGKLDVPKERWLAFPHCEGDDGSLMVAWAGFNHLQLSRAISTHYVDVQERLGGRDDPRLIPLLACLIELLPWLKQWHNEVDPEFGLPMGDYFEGFVQEEARNLGLTLDEIKEWQPPERAKGRGRKKAN